jgi:plastocyanin
MRRHRVVAAPKSRFFFAVAACLVGAVMASGVGAAGGGTITGHVQLTGRAPGNSVIRMRRDPACGKLNAGKRVLQEAALVAPDGSVANVFVRLQGSFPAVPVPAQVVDIDQRACIYTPRVVGVRSGQTVNVRNSDALLHNVHALSGAGNGFNTSQPVAGMVYTFRPRGEEMLLVKCDLHSWMTLHVGVVSHPYFAVSGAGGRFTISDVPPGTHTVHAWHERFGELTASVRVTAGETTAVTLTFPDASAGGKR